jgi:hypothetical protein
MSEHVDNPKLSGDEIVSIVPPDGTGVSPSRIDMIWWAVFGGCMVVILFLFLINKFYLQ